MKTPLPLCALFASAFGLMFAPMASAQLSDLALWKVNLGAEVPGAAASPDNGTEGGSDFVGLDYDFTNGGQYVALTNASTITDSVKELRFKVFVDTPHNIAVRIVDSQGEVFQYTAENVTPGQWSDQRIKLSEAPTTRFMSDPNATGNEQVDFPIIGVWLIIQNNPHEDPQGKVKFRNIEVR